MSRDEPISRRKQKRRLGETLRRVDANRHALPQQRVNSQINSLSRNDPMTKSRRSTPAYRVLDRRFGLSAARNNPEHGEHPRLPIKILDPDRRSPERRRNSGTRGSFVRVPKRSIAIPFPANKPLIV